MRQAESTSLFSELHVWFEAQLVPPDTKTEIYRLPVDGPMTDEDYF